MSQAAGDAGSGGAGQTPSGLHRSQEPSFGPQSGPTGSDRDRDQIAGAPWGRAGESAATTHLRRDLAAILRRGAPPGVHLAGPAALPAPAPPAPVDWTLRDWAHLDWPHLQALAQAERLDALLYTAVLGAHAGNVPPPPVRAALEAAYWRTKVANLLALDAVDQLTGALAAVDVPSVLLKGAALAFTLYPDAARRPLGDLDVLVHPHHVATALRVLALLGYVPAPGGPAPASQPATRVCQRRCQVTLLRDAQSPHQLPVQVDLHWSLNNRALLRRTMDAPWFWDHARPAAISRAGGGRALWVLGDEAQLLHLCAHTLQHGIPRLRWTYDMALLLARRPLAWEVVLSGAERCGLGLAVQSSLAAVALIWGIAPPAWVEERLAALPVSGAELRLRRATWSGDSRAVAAADLLSQPDLGSALDVWLAAALPPAAYLQARYKLADPHLLPACYLLHAVRGTVLAEPRRAAPARQRWARRPTVSGCAVELCARGPRTRRLILLTPGGAALGGWRLWWGQAPSSVGCRQLCCLPYCRPVWWRGSSSPRRPGGAGGLPVACVSAQAGLPGSPAT